MTADDRGSTRMSADARGGEPRRGESDGTSSISRASDDRGFPRMPGEVSRGEAISRACAESKFQSW